jgi:hypothetical protein
LVTSRKEDHSFEVVADRSQDKDTPAVSTLRVWLATAAVIVVVVVVWKVVDYRMRPPAPPAAAQTAIGER